MIETTRSEWKHVKLYLCGRQIVQNDEIKYLGNQITSNGKARVHIEKRKSKAIAALGQLRTNGILNPEMETKNKLELFNIYVKPLIYYGIETFDLNGGDIDLLEKTEGNLLKSLLSVPNKCHSTLLYSALKINTTLETIQINQYKFLIRAINNSFINKFIIELLKLQTKTNVIGKLKLKIAPNIEHSIENLKTTIDSELDYLGTKVYDRFNYNNEVSEVLKILSYTNAKYRFFKLMRKLYFNTQND